MLQYLQQRFSYSFNVRCRVRERTEERLGTAIKFNLDRSIDRCDLPLERPNGDCELAPVICSGLDISDRDATVFVENSIAVRHSIPLPGNRSIALYAGTFSAHHRRLAKAEASFLRLFSTLANTDWHL